MIVEYYNSLKTLLQLGMSEPVLRGDLVEVCTFKSTAGKLLKHHKKSKL